MNILHVTTIKEWRGGDAQMYTTYHFLKEKEDINQIILCPTGSVLSKMCKNDSTPCYTAPKKINLDFRFALKILKICKKEKIDILHTHDSTALTLSLLVIKLLPKIKLIYSRKRNNPIKDKVLNRWKYSHPRIEKILCVSDAVKQIYDRIPIEKGRLITIYDGIDTEKFREHNNQHILHKDYDLPNSTLIVGNIAGLTPQKDLFTFIDVAKKVLENTEKNIKFFVIGDGEQKEDLMTYRDKHNLRDDVIFTGFRNDVVNILPEFDVLLMTSVEEGLPLTIYEAFACNVPVVSTKAGGIAEAVINNLSGITTEIKNVEALANGVTRILNDTDFKNKLTAKGKHLSEEKFNLKRMQKEYYKFYKSL